MKKIILVEDDALIMLEVTAKEYGQVFFKVKKDDNLKTIKRDNSINDFIEKYLY